MRTRLPPSPSHRRPASWQWLLDNCDNAGVIEPDLELASFHIGYQYPIDTLSKLGDRACDLGGGKWFIPKFIGFQYGELSKDCKAHNPVFASIKKHGLEGYPKGIHRDQEKDKDKEKEKDRKRKATIEEVKLHCAKIGLPESDAIWFFNKCEGNGWTNGGRPIVSWANTITSWKAGEYMPSQKAKQEKQKAANQNSF